MAPPSPPSAVLPPTGDVSRFVPDGLVVTRTTAHSFGVSSFERRAPLCVWNRLLDVIGCV